MATFPSISLQKTTILALSRNKINFLLSILLILGVLATIYVVKQQQDRRSLAAGANFTTSPKTYFPYGVFNEANLGASAFPSLASDLKSHNLDSIFYHNADASYVNQIGAAADAEGGIDIFVGPWQELTTQWYNNSTVTTDIATARSIVYPLVDQMGNHPSVKGINVHDDVQNNATLKNALVVQAINERDPSRPVLPTFLYNHNLPYSAIANQDVYLSYSYPAKVVNDYCDFSFKGVTSPGGNFFAQNLRRQRQLNRLNSDHSQFWMGLQTHGRQTNYDPNSTDLTALRTPTVEELRMQMWQALGEDVKGIFWFMYPTEDFWTGLKDNTTLYPEVSTLGGRIKPLKATLLGIRKDYDEKFTASVGASLPLVNQPYVSTMTKNDGSSYYVIVDNASCSPQSISVATDAFSGGQLKDLETAQTYDLNTPISFQGGDGKIFELINATLTKSPPQASSNLVQNSSFETNANGTPANWGARTGMSWDNTVAHTGTASMKVVGPTDFTYTPQDVTLKPNTQYSLSYFVKTENVTGKGVTARYLPYQPTTTYLPETDAENGKHDWKQVVTTFFTPSNMTQGRVDLIWYLNSGDTAWIDDVILCEGPLGCNGTFTVPSLNHPPFPIVISTTTPTSAVSPTPSTSYPMPQVDPDYTKDIESWWSSHPFNPENTNSIPVGAIQNPQPVVNVKSEFDGDIQAAINSLPATGGTLFFEEGTYQHNGFHVIGKSNVHFVSNAGATIVGGRLESSNTYASSSAGLITTCSEAASYRTFTSAVFETNNPLHTTALNCIKNPNRNIYFKNITFDGGGSYYSALRLVVLRDVLFDNVTFQNFIPDGSYLDGMVNGAMTINNIWFRSSTFKNKGEYAVYLDGLHGGGVINSRIETQRVGGFAMLTNDDYTYDYDGNGTIEPNEQRIGDYLVLYGNSFATTNYPLRATSAHTLMKNNIVDGFIINLANFDRKNSPITTHQYNFYGNRLIGNKTQNVQYLVDFGQPDCSAGISCDRMGQYQIRDNTIQSAGSFVDLVGVTGTLTIDGPNTQSNNCINGTIYGTTNPCTTTPTPTPTNSPQSTPTPTPTRAPTSTPTLTPTPSSDNTKPTITITYPRNGDIVPRRQKITISATATDNIAVNRVVFEVAGNVSIDYDAPYSYVWSVPGKPNINYPIKATAYDNAGNNAVSSIQVTSSK